MLKISNLSKTYPNGVIALSRVSLDIPAGMYGLLGPNGAGKSTLMRTVATLQQPDAGSIELDGLDILGNPVELRQQLGYLPQDFGVYPRISALDMMDHMAILKGFTNKKQRREVVDGLLLQTNLHDVRKKALAGFSGGMRQRVLIAMALSCEPELLIADEPTTALDVTIQAQILELLADIQDRLGLSILLITHDLGVVAGICDRVCVMYSGRLAEVGPADDLYDRPAHPYFHGLLRSTPRVDEVQARMVSIEGAPPDLVAPPPGCPFSDRCDSATDRCRTELPRLTRFEEGRSVACWHPFSAV